MAAGDVTAPCRSHSYRGWHGDHLCAGSLTGEGWLASFHRYFFSFSSCQVLLQTLWEFPFPELPSSPRQFPCARGIFGVFLLQGWLWEAKAVPVPAGQLFRSPGCCSDTSFVKREVFAQSFQHGSCAPPMNSRCKAILQLGASSPGRKSSFRPSVSIAEIEITVQGRNVLSFSAVLWLSGSLQEAGSQVWGREAEKHQDLQHPSLLLRAARRRLLCGMLESIISATQSSRTRTCWAKIPNFMCDGGG